MTNMTIWLVNWRFYLYETQRQNDIVKVYPPHVVQSCFKVINNNIAEERKPICDIVFVLCRLISVF